ncbi:MAG: hypothetical protein K2X82_32580 [Gemmataceae bacterium]|nr:hypothetical protein [Gemmataceae bacterium]
MDPAPNPGRRSVWESWIGSAVRPLGHLFAFYPLLLSVPVVLLLFLWGWLMTEYDAFHQLWSEDPVTGVLAGAVAATVFGEVVLAVYLLDRGRIKPAVETSPATDGGLRPVPRWGYWAAWGLLLLVAVVPPLIWQADEFQTRVGDARVAGMARVWFPAGVFGMAAVYGLLRWLFPSWYARPERFGLGVVVVLGTGYVAMTIAHAVSPGLYVPWVPAAVSLLLSLGFGLGVLALFAWLAGRTPWLYPGLIALVAVPVLIPSCQTEYRLPHMDITGKDGASYYDEPARLVNYDALRKVPAADAGLVPDAEARDNWQRRMTARYGAPQPVVLVMVSGGASASAIYTADVLFTLEEEFPGFADRVRVVSGASGGMLGAAYFVTQLRPGGLIADARATPEYRRYAEVVVAVQDGKGDPAAVAAAEGPYRKVMAEKREAFFAGLEADFLGPLTQKWVHQDMPFAPRMWGTTNDRGRALELAWSRHLNGALDVPFRQLQPDERAGSLPSLVFTPMMIEDGRQVIISNLDLDYMVDPARDSDDAPMSLMGVEFFRLFPKANDFRLSTAVRMNASFPFFSPSAALPTDPVRHVVDAGYYDNYGAMVALNWLGRNLDWLTGTGGAAGGRPPEVILLRLRSFGYQLASRQVVTTGEVERYGRTAGREATDGLDPDDPAERPEWVKKATDHWKGNPPARPVRTQGGVATVTGPLVGLFSSWRANMVYRADERLAAALQRLKGSATVSDYLLECQANPSLNWVLTTDDRAAIHADVRQNLRLAALATNLGRGRSAGPADAADQGLIRQAGVRPGSPRLPTWLGGSPADRVTERRPEYQAAPGEFKRTMRDQAGAAAKLGGLKVAPPPK